MYITVKCEVILLTRSTDRVKRPGRACCGTSKAGAGGHPCAILAYILKLSSVRSVNSELEQIGIEGEGLGV